MSDQERIESEEDGVEIVRDTREEAKEVIPTDGQGVNRLTRELLMWDNEAGDFGLGIVEERRVPVKTNRWIHPNLRDAVEMKSSSDRGASTRQEDVDDVDVGGSDGESDLGEAEMIGKAEWRWDGQLDEEQTTMRKSARHMWDEDRVEQQRSSRPSDSELMKKALGGGFLRISFELKCWWWFVTEVLEQPKRRLLKGIFDWRGEPVVVDGVDLRVRRVPRMDVVGGETRELTEWEKERWLELCLYYEALTLNPALPFRVVDDVDEAGTWHGLQLVCVRKVAYAVMRECLPMFVEHFSESEFPLLRQHEVGSLLKCWKATEGDELTYLFGPGKLMQHRHQYEVRFGCDSNAQVALGCWKEVRGESAGGGVMPVAVIVHQGGRKLWRLKATSLTSKDNTVLKPEWFAGELITCGYSAKAKLSELCRCLTCIRARQRREREKEKKRRETRNGAAGGGGSGAKRPREG